jgi:dihydroorotase
MFRTKGGCELMIVIKNALLIDPANNSEGDFDILIEKDKISAVEKPGSFQKLEVESVIDAKGKWIVPGFFDMHVHLREPGFEWKETIQSGTQAALLGGFTSVCCMPNTKPVNDNAEITKFILEKAKHADAARVFPIGSVTQKLEGKEMSPLSELREAGCVAFSDDGEPVFNSGIMRRALEWAGMLDAVICCHEEDKHLSCGGSMNESALSSKLGLKGFPKVAEEVMIARDIELARTTKSRVHICHVSTARSVELIRRAKNDGIRITCEATPHHIVLTEDSVGDYDTNAKMSPPLREQEDCEAILAGLNDGTIDVIASDHAPHELDSKQIEFSKAAFGILGLQTSLPLVLDFVRSGKIKRKRAIEILSSAGAEILKLNLGRLSKGCLADLVIVDPEYKWTFSRQEVKSLSFNSPFIGKEMQGIAEAVFVGGRMLVEGRKLKGVGI